MGEDEVFAMIVSVGVAIVTWAWWYLPLARGDGQKIRRASDGAGVLAGAAPIVALALVVVVLATASARDVRTDGRYIFMYALMGAGWIGAGLWLFSLVGPTLIDDVVHNHNRAAGAVLGGASIGLALAFSGGNIGDGPGWWVVVFCGGLSTALLALCWLVLGALGHAHDEVTVERDAASGARIGLLGVSVGLVGGRAVAGNWVSSAATVDDFLRCGWPAAVLVAVEVLALRSRRRARASGQPPSQNGWLGAAYFVAAVAWVIGRGPW